MMKADPEIEAVRIARREISQACGHDPRRLVRFYQRYTAELKKAGRYRFIGASEPAKPKATLVKR